LQSVHRRDERVGVCVVGLELDGIEELPLRVLSRLAGLGRVLALQLEGRRAGRDRNGLDRCVFLEGENLFTVFLRCLDLGLVLELQ
jgi:hypothetical protein